MILDRKFLLGLGIGLVISALLMLSFPPSGLSKADVEKAARDMGMVYGNEVKAMFDSNK